jgi:hypothetical protein
MHYYKIQQYRHNPQNIYLLIHCVLTTAIPAQLDLIQVNKRAIL